MTVYATQIANAIRVIGEKGMLVNWTIPVPASGSHSWNEGAAGTPLVFPVRILFLPANLQSMAFVAYLMKTEIPKGGTLGLMASVAAVRNVADTVTGFTPALEHYVARTSDNLKALAINPLAPDGEPILYDIRFDG